VRPRRVLSASTRRAAASPVCGAGPRNPLTSSGRHESLSAPAWYFDLHPVARDLPRANGEVPLQLAHHLHSQGRRYIDASELELCNAVGTPIAEIDLLAYADGQVIVAEALNQHDQQRSGGVDHDASPCRLGSLLWLRRWLGLDEGEALAAVADLLYAESACCE
jgi:hypothetical protein